jgi:superfamily II DNA helicase RecQ
MATSSSTSAPHESGASLREQLIEETTKRTGNSPYDWQLVNVMDRLADKDTMVIAGTGSGKSLTFAVPHFVLEDAITWLLGPLNYIMEQQVKIFNKWGIPSVCVNSNTRWAEAKRVSTPQPIRTYTLIALERTGYFCGKVPDRHILP